MTSALAKYSEIAVMSSSQQGIRHFCPLIIYHDSPSQQLEQRLNANKQHDRTAIDVHREKTNEMMQHNAQFWNECEADIRVSPSTSTTSNISSSSSSSSSGDSVATMDQRMMETPATKTTANNNYYTAVMEDYHHAATTTTTSTSTPSSTATAKDACVKRRRGNLPKEVTEFLRQWLIQHKKHPYPAEKEKADLARHTGLTVNQISNWFINARRRILQPMLESENLTAQMMAYPELVNHQQHPPTAGAFFEPPRRRRHDFYTYQRDFTNAPPSPPYYPSMPHHHHHHHEQPQPYQHPHHYYPDLPSRFQRLMDPNDHHRQLSMR